MAHFADCELVFAWRLRQILATDAPALHGFNQDSWANRYFPIDFAAAQRTFDTLRAWNLLLLETVTDADRPRTGTHEERGTVTFQTTLENIAGHDLHHLRQLERLLKREGLLPAYPGNRKPAEPTTADVPSPS